MQEQLKMLYRLQQVDDQIDAIKYEARSIPLKIQELNSQIEEQKLVVDQKKAGLENLVKTRKEKEMELEDKERKIANDKTKLMEVKTNKEYHALQKEISGIEESMGVLEEEILLLMDDMEQYDVETKKVAARFNTRKKEIDEKIGECEKRLAQIPGELKEQNAERESVTGEISKELLMRYEATREQRDGQAVAFVERGICMGCNMQIPPQLFNMIQRNEDVYTCPQCYRILYFPGEATVNDLEI